MLATAGLSICLVLLLLAAPLPAEAQQAGRIARIGLLANNTSPHLQAFETGLRELGYVEGQNVVIERRNATGESSRLPALAAELSRLGLDVIVAPDPPSTRAARSATSTIPIVMRSSDDPVESRLVTSLARPGGNVTGVYSLYAELGPKRQGRALLGPHAGVGGGEQFDLLESAFRVAMRQRAEALITLRNPVIVVHKSRVVELAASGRLPAMYDDREFVEAGGLMAYGANLDDLYRRAATYVDKILKGARPADLPIERATKFEFVINLKTARALGLTIPPALLLRADHVIE